VRGCGGCIFVMGGFGVHYVGGATSGGVGGASGGGESGGGEVVGGGDGAGGGGGGAKASQSFRLGSSRESHQKSKLRSSHALRHRARRVSQPFRQRSRLKASIPSELSCTKGRAVAASMASYSPWGLFSAASHVSTVDGHTRQHAVEPGASLDSPAPHGTHVAADVAPGSVEYVPTGHGEHDVDFAGE